MNEERVKQISGKLHRLASLESLVQAGTRKLHGMTAAACDALNQNLVDVQGHKFLTIVPPVELGRSHSAWSIRFNQREALEFEVTDGAAPAAPSSIAQCAIRLSSKPCATLHYFKVNHHGLWKTAESDLSQGVEVSGDMIVDLLEGFFDEELARYG